MLEHVPEWLGALLRGRRAGHERLLVAELGSGVATRFDLASPAFADGERLPLRFTADGEGISPPLVWRGAPEAAASLALIVEDADAPTARPLVHALVWNIPPERRDIAEGVIAANGGGGSGGDVGRNSFLGQSWLPPDPPTGHGEHDYVFQLFALSGSADIDANPGRAALAAAIEGKVLAAAVLIGTYSRGDEAPIGVGSTMVPSGGLATR